MLLAAFSVMGTSTRGRKPLLHWWLALVIGLLLTACDGSGFEQNVSELAPAPQPAELTLAVLPYLSAPHLYDAFAPLADHLSDALGVPVRIKTAADFDEFVEQTLRQRYDLVVSNPYLYLALNERGGYLPLVADGRAFQTVLVSRADSAIEGVEDLRQARIGMLSPGAFAGYLLPVDYLHSQGLTANKDFEVITHSSFDLILTALRNGDIEAGCFWKPVYDAFSPATRAALRTIATTESFVNDPYAVRADLPQDWQATIREALLGLNEQAGSSDILTPIGVKQFIQVRDADYEPVREFARRSGLQP